MAHCSKCNVHTTVERQKIDCHTCSNSLVYYCVVCKEQFSSFSLVKNHEIEGLKKISIFSKCSKCCRSHFSTKCSLLKHTSKCNAPFRIDKEISVKLQRCDDQTEILRSKFCGIKVYSF